MESVGYCVRVQALDGYREKLAELRYDNIVAVKHLGAKGDNPHYHIVIRTEVKSQAFRVRMRNAFPQGKGNSHMSIKSWDGDDKAISYLFHEEVGDEEAEILRWDGIPRERIDYFRQMNIREKVKVTEAKKKSAHLLWETAYNHFKHELPNVPKDRYVNDRDIAEFMVLDALRNDKYVPQAWLLKAMTFKVLFLLCEGHVDNEVRQAKSIVSMLWPEPKA